MTIEECDRLLVKEKCISLPIYMYDHSGITIRTYPFECPWDSGQIGYIYVTYAQILKELDIKRLSPKARKWAYNLLRGEINVYNQYLTGEVYGYVIEKTVHCDHCKKDSVEIIDSCWGFYGFDSVKDDLGLMEAEWVLTL
jgi:hypothetical protein